MWFPTLTLGVAECALAACGEEVPPMSAFWLERPEATARALGRAPAGGPVALQAGRTDGERAG